MSEKDIDQIKEDLRDVRNDIEKIKSDTSSLNRISVLSNREYIIQDLIDIVNNNSRKAIMPVLLKEEKTTGELSTIMKIARTNVYRYLREFIKKGYIYTIKMGKNTYYIRSEILDLIYYEEIDGIKTLISEWYEEQHS
ncbi:MAG: winged helix-turn-helix domain-containing protein [Candidatus Odinarchaeia archaeon]